ncbi:methyl-accepting chemotaxis protein [Roseospira visakhapatnamensis]|uniref:Methyl-accepting chemotaxis protein n=1 Tax=Roseospira visakhapatnamensis TaxID=390880 RepID=A0A7W6REB9_9PROT|nr:methyl-accepting chemotaxis protein [Roseospira visakhapatnamensis]MBB4266857.1 methyl-accepting chemotaxis protein [Roseospira visakhapatnamensis]
MTKLGLKAQISVVAAGMVVVALVLATGTALYLVRAALHDGAMRITNQAADVAANTVQRDLEDAFTVARDNALVLEAMRAGEVTDRRQYSSVQRALLEGHEELLGVWTGWEPDALDGRDAAFADTEGHDATGRFLEYWYRSDGTIARDILLDYETPGAGDYYLIPRNSNRETILEPYLYPVGGKEVLITTLAVPIHHGGQVVGVAGVDVALASIQRDLAAIRPMDAGWVTLVTENGTILADRSPEVVGRKAAEAGFGDAVLAAIDGGRSYIDERATSIDGIPVLRVVSPLKIGHTDTTWTVVTNIPSAAALADVNDITWKLLTLTVVVAGVAVALAWFSGRQVSNPIVAMTTAMGRLAKGDLSVETPGMDRRDEIGAMASAVEVFKENSRKIEALQAEQEAAHRRNARRVQTEMFALTNALDEEVRSAIAIVQQQTEAMHDASVEMTDAIDHTEQGAGAASAASQESSASVDAVAAAAEEMSSSIGEISRQVSGASDIAHRAARQAEGTNTRIQGLAEAADKIGVVVNLISDIAKQTNLLALNATIEAARAGEAGKGFAVVANEVKTLATQTAKATDDIAEQIGGMQAATREAVEAIQGIVTVIGEINEITTGVSAAVEEQTAATREISQNAQQAAHSTQEASDNIAAVSGRAETTGRHASDVRQSAEEVRERVQHMQDALERIIRAGSAADREANALRTLNLAVTVDLGDGQRRACLLQDVAASGVGTLDRSLTADRGQTFGIDIPGIGHLSGVVVAQTAASTHIRLDMSEAEVRAFHNFVSKRA